MRLQKLKGELIDRARAMALVFRLAREERDAWVNWPARVAALMAAELGRDDAITVSRRCRRCWKHMSAPTSTSSPRSGPTFGDDWMI